MAHSSQYILLTKVSPFAEWEISRERGATKEESYQYLPAGRNNEHCSSFYPKALEAQEPKEPVQYYSNQFTSFKTYRHDHSFLDKQQRR